MGADFTLSSNGLRIVGEQIAAQAVQALREWENSETDKFRTPLTQDEILILGPALALASRSSAPFYFPVDGHGLVISNPQQISCSTTLRPFDADTLLAIEIRMHKDSGNETLTRVARLIRSTASKIDTLLHPRFAGALELFLKAHPLNPEEDRWTALIQDASSHVLDLLTTEQQTDLLGIILEAQTTDSLQLRILASSHGQDHNLLIYGAGRSLPAVGWASLLCRITERYDLEWRDYAQTAPKVDCENVRAFALILKPIKGTWSSSQAEEQIAALAREIRFATVFSEQDRIEQVYVQTRKIRGDLAAVLRSMVRFCHQGLLYIDPFEFNLANCEDAFCAHSEVVEILLQAFEMRFHPTLYDDVRYRTYLQKAQQLTVQLNTGHEGTDRRRRLILEQGISFIEHILKTTFYTTTASLAYRLNPAYLERLPSAALEKFPEIPFGIFLLFQCQSIGFHIRFRDLARGGLRTVIPQHMEQFVIERNQIFQEGYNLAFTQQKKNKDIPEGGAKGILLLNPFETFLKQEEMFQKLLRTNVLSEEHGQKQLGEWKNLMRSQALYRAQRQYIEGLLLLVNCNADDKLRDLRIRDLYGKPEYLYVGPDENMHNSMLVWIAETAKRVGYRPGSAFISSKPGIGINHKEYGVTSLGVHVYVEEILRYLGIHPTSESFSVKMSGGPDGDVAGNEMLNLYRSYPNTCVLLSVIDGSGTIYDPQGLDLSELDHLFYEAQPIRNYPISALHEGGYFIDSRAQKDQEHGAPLMLRKRKEGKIAVDEWIPQSEAFQLLRNTMFQAQTDLFIPAGGRPRTLNENNIEEFCLPGGEPSVRAIVEGANLFLTPKARRFLEERGTLIIKDSSANKGGVICSSFEVLLGLTLSEEEFLNMKAQLMPEVLEQIRNKALAEAQLLLRSHEESGKFLTDISDEISARINLYKDQLLSYFTATQVDFSPGSIYANILLDYCPRTLREQFADRVLIRLPETHQKAILACQIAAMTVYQKGLDWSPSIVEVLPVVTAEWGNGGK